MYMDIERIKKTAQSWGSFFFSPENMRFFKSRISPTTHCGPGGIYFVTSEKWSFNSRQRRYTVRKLDRDTQSITTPTIEGENGYQSYQTSRAAHREAERLAKGEAYCAPR